MTEVKDEEIKEVEEKPFEWNPGTIKTALKEKRISEDEGTNLFLDWRLRGNIYDMEPDEVKLALKKKKMSPETVEKYLNRKENPIWWHTKDLVAGVTKGVESGISNIFTAFNELPVISHGIDAWNWLTPEFAKVTKSADVDILPSPEAMSGNIAKSIAQFTTGFIPAGRIIKALNVGNKILQSKLLVNFAKDMPKIRAFMQVSVEGMAAGAAADYATFDPFEGRASDFMDDLGILPEYLDFMTTNPDNPAALERFKNVLEGAAIGGAFDTVLFGVKALKTSAYRKYFGDLDEMAREINNVSRLSESYNKAKIAELEDLAQRPVVDEGVAKGEKKIGAQRGAKEAEKEVSAYRIFKKVEKGAEPEIDPDTFMMKMEEFEDAEQLVRHIYDETEAVIEAERKTITQKVTEAGAQADAKKLGKLVGGDVDGIMNHMRNIYGDVKGATRKVKLMYNTLTTYSDLVAKMAKAHDGSTEGTLKIVEHMKMLQELQAMCYGVRAESGRLLNMHNMKHNKARFDFTDFQKMGDLPEYVTKNKEKFEAMIKEYSAKGTAAEKLKFTRFLGKGGFSNWLLSLSQASKLWSPVTHIVNTTSQTGAVIFRLAAKGFANTAMSVQKLDPVYMKSMVKEMAGLGQALKVCFRKPSRLKGAKAVAKAEGITIKEAFMKDPELGTFYKSFFGREGVIDPSIKWDDAAIAIGNSRIAKVGRTMDAIIKIPFNFLSGVDEVFKTVGTQMDYYSRVYGEGIEKGYRGVDLDVYFKDAMQKGRPDHFNEALKVGREVTFQDDLGKMSKHVEQALNANAFGLGLRTFFIPFYKTTVNLTKYAAKNSPLGLASKNVWKKLGKGGVDMYETIARITMGTGAMYWAWNAYEEGNITGRLPRDQRSVLQAGGILEYAHYDEKTREWTSMRRGDPFALWLGLAADLHMAMDTYDNYKMDDMDVEFHDVWAAFLAAAVEPTINATWMKGMNDFMKIAGDPEKSARGLKTTAIKAVEGLMPGTTLIDYINSEFGSDSYYRELHDLVDIITKKVNSKALLPKRDAVYGTPVPREDRYLHAFHKRTMTEDKAKLELIRTGAEVRSPKEYLMAEGVKVRLTPEELDRFEQIYSEFPVKETLNTIVASKGFQAIREDRTKAEKLKAVISTFREGAKGLFLAENDKVTQAIIDKVVRRAEAIAGFHVARDSSSALYYWEKYTR